MNACKKGKAGEREAAHFLSELFGLPVARGAQHAGGVESPDVRGVPGIHFEVKRVQALNLGAAMAQAERDAGAELVPVVLHRRNREGWRMTFRADDLWRLVQAAQNAPGSRAAGGAGVEPSGNADAPERKIDALPLDLLPPPGHSSPSVNPGT